MKKINAMNHASRNSETSSVTGSAQKAGSKRKKHPLALALLATAIGCLTGCVTDPEAKPQSNGDFVRHYYQVVDGKQAEKIGELEAPGVVFRLPLGTMDGPTHAQVIKGFAIAFPNFKHTITRCVESGDLVSCEGTFTGDHTGPLAMADGSVLPATQKHV